MAPMQPFVPHVLPINELDWRLLLPLVGQANAALARYDGLLAGIPNPAVMLSPLTTQEAVLSSKIEGTQATVDEVLEQEAGLLKEGEKYEDIREISNYRQALYQAREYLKDYPIRLAFVRELHRTLMSAFPAPMPPEERVLFRLDQQRSQPGLSILVQSAAWPDWNGLSSSNYLLQPAAVKEFSCEAATGQVFRFRLLANPTKRLKGETRPVNPLEQRMIVLGALESVDWVVSFEEDTPQRLIAGILPDLLVKGGDYKPEDIAGSKEVWANGGEVLVLNFEDGCSTTNIIKKIQKDSDK